MQEKIISQLITRMRCYYLAYQPQDLLGYLEKEEDVTEMFQGLGEVMSQEDILSLGLHMSHNLREFIAGARALYHSDALVESANELIRQINLWDILPEEKKEKRREKYIQTIFDAHGLTKKDTWYLALEEMRVTRAWDYLVMDSFVVQNLLEDKIPTPDQDCFSFLAPSTYYLVEQGYFDEDKEQLQQIKNTLQKKESWKYRTKTMMKKIDSKLV